jgi:hypothetical protein
MSRGADFISEIEGLFCDMEAHKLWPVCSQDVVNGCFDLDKNDLRGFDGRKRTIVPSKQYHGVEKWSWEDI